MYPLYFGNPDEPLYGVYHMPESLQARPVGAVLCQPVLHEGTNARRALRSLGEQLARTGLHALRFDYHGTGDSGGSSDGDDVERWTADIGTAIEELRVSRGLDAVGVIGLRFGASMAAVLASRRNDLPFLVLWEPIVDGASYVESLRRLQASWLDYESAERPGARRHATPHEVLGHPLTPALAQSVGGTDLRRASGPLATRVLLVDEGSGERIEALAGALTERGARVEHVRHDGGHVWSREFDGEQAQVPRAVLQHIVSWVDQGDAPMKEHAVRFGQWRSLVGVVTEPDEGARIPDAPLVLFLNSGLLHHVGPHRLHVHLARRMSLKGLRSLRFDLSGIGDSGPRQDRMGRDESMVRETQEAMDAMAAAHGATTFVLFGICTGADQAVRVGLEDPRVAAAVLVDGYAYETFGHQLHYYADRFLRPSSWWHVLSLQHPLFGRLASRLRGVPAPPRKPALPVPRPGIYMRPAREEAEARIGRLTARGCRLCFVFTPSPRFSHASQFRTMFPSLAKQPLIRVEFLKHANHVFTLLASQEALMDAVEAWLADAVLRDLAARSRA